MNKYKSHYLSFDNWFYRPQGRHIAQLFTEIVPRFNLPSGGQILLQLGTFGENLWLPLFNYPKKIIASPLIQLGRPCHLYTGFDNLALESSSIDLVIAPFLIESCICDFSPFDEIDRILKEMGIILLWGINPFGFWGLALKLGLLAGIGRKDFHMMSYFSIIKEMKRRGYQQYFFETFQYAPPVKSESMIKRLEFLNQMGKMIALTPSGFYCILMQKYTLDPNLLWINERRDAFAI